MPYKSEKQRRYMHAKHPDIAARWDAEIRAKKKVSKQAPSKRLRYQKKVSAGTSIAGGTLGLGGLAALAMKKNDLATKLAIGSSGLGGLGAYNYASIQNQEAKIGQRKRIKKEAGFAMMDFGLDGANPQEVSKRSAEEATKIENAAFGGSAGALGTGYFGSKAYQSAKAGYGLSRGTLGYSKKGSAKSAVKAAGSGLKGAANLTRAMEAAYNKPGATLALGVGGAIAGGKAMEHKLKKSKVSKKDWMNISEHERRARDSRRTRKRGESVAGFGGAAITGAVAHNAYARNNSKTYVPNVENQLKTGQQTLKDARRVYSLNRAPGAPRRWALKSAGNVVRAGAKKSPHAAVLAGGAALMGAGGATMAGARMNEKRHDRAIARQRKSRVNKAFGFKKPHNPLSFKYARSAASEAKHQSNQAQAWRDLNPPGSWSGSNRRRQINIGDYTANSRKEAAQIADDFTRGARGASSRADREIKTLQRNYRIAGGAAAGTTAAAGGVGYYKGKKKVSKALKMPKVAKPAVAAPKVPKPQIMQQPQIAKPKPPKMPRPDMIGKRDLVFKAYNPEDRRYRRAEHTATGLAIGAGGAGAGAVGYGRSAGRDFKEAKREWKSGFQAEKERTGAHAEAKVREGQMGKGASGNAQNLSNWKRAANSPGGGAEFMRAKGSAFKGAKKAGRAGALGLTAVGLAVGSERVRSYNRKGRGATYRPLHRSA